MLPWQERLYEEHEARVRSYHPEIVFLYNPRIQRWVICEDMRVTRVKNSPWIDTDPDLVGVGGIGEKTFLKALFKCEAADGKPFEPHSDIVLGILKYEFPRNGEKSAAGVVKRQMESDEERWQRWLNERVQQIMEELPPLLRGRKTIPMSQ